MKKLSIIGAVLLLLGIISGFIQSQYYGYVDAQGVLHDSVFLPLAFYIINYWWIFNVCGYCMVMVDRSKGINRANNMNWTLFDYVVMCSLLAGCICSYYIASHVARTKKQKHLVLFAVVVLFLVVWAELAVGVFGTPFAGN